MYEWPIAMRGLAPQTKNRLEKDFRFLVWNLLDWHLACEVKRQFVLLNKKHAPFVRLIIWLLPFSLPPLKLILSPTLINREYIGCPSKCMPIFIQYIRIHMPSFHLILYECLYILLYILLMCIYAVRSPGDEIDSNAVCLVMMRRWWCERHHFIFASIPLYCSHIFIYLYLLEVDVDSWQWWRDIATSFWN